MKGGGSVECTKRWTSAKRSPVSTYRSVLPAASQCQKDSVRQREKELEDGHGEFAYAGIIVTTAASEDDLRAWNGGMGGDPCWRGAPKRAI